MPRTKRKIEFKIVIDGLQLNWRLHREQQWCTADGWKGVAIHVATAQGTFRELFLEYPPTTTHKMGAPRMEPLKQTISPKLVELHIRQAIEAGWDPQSRGKPYVHEVAELPG